VIEFEKFELDKIKRAFIERACKIRRMRQRIVEIWGTYYWEDIPEKEIEDLLESTLITNINHLPIHNEA
jgi:hypothetical protein